MDVVEIDESNWLQAVAVEVRDDQLRFVAAHQPVALVILSKAYVGAEGCAWTPYVAIEGAEAVGVAAVAFDGIQTQLRHVAVDHRRQGQGLGRLLVGALVTAVRSTQPMSRSVIVTTHPDNAIALALYHSVGFRRTGEMKGIEPVLSLSLDLDE